jgi:cytidine deaminase
VLAEFGDFPVLLADHERIRSTTTVAELLPDAFGADDLPTSGG